MRYFPHRKTWFFLSLWLALSGCAQGPSVWWQSLNAKVKAMRSLEANYAALTLEHERLKREFYQLENEHMELRARVESKESGEHNLQATGSLIGRSPASISYKIPNGLKREELLTLAYEHFNEQRFSEAAVSFEEMRKQPEAAALMDAGALYTAGVCWFQVGNFHKARARLVEARELASGDQREKIHKKVDLWLRVIDRKSVGEKAEHAPAEGH